MKPVTQSILLNGITAALGTARADEGPEDSLIATRGAGFVPRKILLAEDGVVNRKVAVGLLEQRGHRVTAVENGQLAVDAVSREPFDVVLMDVQMPVLDGFAATAAIRKFEAGRGHLPIIAMTAHAMKGDRQRCLDAGMDAYVSKPFRPQELFDAVEQANITTASPTAPDGVSPSMDGGTTTPPVYDRAEALRNVGGSLVMLTETAELLASEGPKQLADIEAALASGNCEAVMRAAHTLKGSVSLFGAAAATAAARRLESLGREGAREEFSAAWADVQRDVGELMRALEELYAPGHKAGARAD
jgi:CheY-like chemotaxis protein